MPSKTHFWESFFKGNSDSVTAEFNKYVIDYITLTSSSPYPEWVSVPQLPEGCFTADGGLFLDALIFSGTLGNYPSFLETTAKYGGASSLYQNRLTPIDQALESTTGLAAGSLPLWLYNPYKARSGDVTSAYGKIITTFNPDIFGDGTTSAFQAWAGGIVISGKVTTSNADIDTPMMAQLWTPTTSAKKRATGASWSNFIGALNFTGIEAAFY